VPYDSGVSPKQTTPAFLSDLRILIVADDPLVRAGLSALLTDRPGYTVVGQMAADADVLVGLDIYRPEVVLWDLGWEPTRALSTPQSPSVSGQDEARTRLDRLVDLRDTGQPVVVLLPDCTYAATTWAAGIRCLLLRDVSVEKLAASLAGAMQGLTVLDASLATILLPVRQAEPAPPGDMLTPRELDVLLLLAEGLPNKLIADRLHISDHTVKFHVNALMGKLGAQSRTEAVVRATRLGLLLL
jgi:DNA-binding NarL/FixJ family response regulator